MSIPWHILNDHAFVQHAANDCMIVGSLYESMYIMDRETQTVQLLDWFYGDPTCAIIGENGQWVLMGGYHLSLYFTFDGTLHEFIIPDVFAMRQTGTWKAEILTDPWCEDAAIWELDVLTLVLRIIRPFPDYIGQPSTEDIRW